MKRIILTLWLVQIAILLDAQIRFVVNAVPNNTTDTDKIYIAGDFNSWNPGNPDFKLTKQSNGAFSIVLNESETIEFKFTRGSWENVEGSANGTYIPNRTYTFGIDTVAYFQIAGWEGESGTHTAEENVTIVDENFYIPQLNRTRRVWIYLPPDYYETTESYPVLYMHDGQNLFDSYYAFSGEWEVDETLNRLHNDGIKVPVVVGIDNGGEHRINEYSPWINTDYGGGEGDAYAAFLVNTLKPYIDENYRTLSNRENTGIMGSSLGGLVSFYAGLTYPEVFSKLGVFSPSFWFNDSVFTLVNNFDKQHNFNIYMIIGSLEGGNTQSDMLNMMDTLSTIGFSNNELYSMVHADGQHSEWYWRREFSDAYQWLFNSYVTNISEDTPVQLSLINMVFDPMDKSLFIEVANNEKYQVHIIDMLGKIVYTDNLSKNITLNLSTIDPGKYIVKTFNTRHQDSINILIK